MLINKSLEILNSFVSSTVITKLGSRVNYNLSKFPLCNNFRSVLISVNHCSTMSDNDVDKNESLTKDFSKWSLVQDPKYADLPLDTENENYIRNYVKNAIFSKVLPTPLKNNVRLVCASTDAMSNILDLDPSVAESKEFLEFVAGEKFPSGAYPVAHRYGGHQFGYWAEQLGDGRAHLIGEYTNRSGKTWELQLKGSGLTPYSRHGDGRAVLRSSIREMIASEAMYHLGVPTTRAAALVVSDDPVIRDVFYSGRCVSERAAVVLRLSPSWFRIGSLEILARTGEVDMLRRLCDFIIKEHFPNIDPAHDDRYIKLYNEIAHSTISLVAKWQGFGFTHGVLNTDNMSLLGLTIDYGPYGFADYYDSDYVPNLSDDGGRYALGKQLQIAVWNLQVLATAMSPLLSTTDREHIAYVHKSLESLGRTKILKTFLKKLGICGEESEDSALVQQLLDMMEQTVADFTMTFYQLGEVDVADLTNAQVVDTKWSLKRLATHHTWPQWVSLYAIRVGGEGETGRRARMGGANPRYVPRNWMMQEAIKLAENNDFSKVRFLMKLIEDPFTINQEAEEMGYASEPPRWAYKLQLSCSS